MRAFFSFCATVVALAGTMYIAGPSDIVYTDKSADVFRPIKVDVVPVGKAYQVEENVMMYNPEVTFRENLDKNIMPLSRAEDKLASGRYPGSTIIPRVNGGYLLPPVDVAEDLLPDGTPVAEATFHEREEAAFSQFAKSEPRK